MCRSSDLAVEPVALSVPCVVLSSCPVFVSSLVELSSTNLALEVEAEEEDTEVLVPSSVVDCVLVPEEEDVETEVFALSSSVFSLEVLELEETCPPLEAVSVVSC